MPKFINPFTDFGFKKIFGEEANKDLLISFLNELLKAEGEVIKQLTFNKNERLAQSSVDRKVIYDLFCENEKGEKFIVEMQKAKQEFFKDRMIYYSSFVINEQGQKGTDKEKRKWNYELKAVYVVAILDFLLDDSPEGKRKPLLSRNKIMDIERHEVFYDKLSFITIEIEKFDKNIDDLETNFDKWLYVLKNLEKFERIPNKLKDKIFKKLFQIAEYANLSKTERMQYEESLSYYRDLSAVVETAQKEGRQKAEKKLLKLVIEKDKQLLQERQKAEQERQKAKEKDKQLLQERQKLIKTVKNMQKDGLSVEIIAKYTGLSENEIEKIIQ